MPSRTTTINLGDIQDAALVRMLGTRSCSFGGLAIGTTKTKVKTANAVDYSIAGTMYTKAATDDLFVHTTTTVQAVGTTKYYALCLDASGTATIVAGAVGATQLPSIGDTVCCVGYLKIVTDATHTFTPGTTNHDAAGITTTYVNVAVAPATLA